MLFFSRAGREIERVWIAATTTITKYKRPQFIIHDVVAGLILERTKKRSGKRGVGINDSVVGKVADEQRATEESKTGRRNCQTPRRVERPAAINSERHIAHAVSIELADKPKSGTV